VLQCVTVCCSVLQCVAGQSTYRVSGCATSTCTLQCGVVCCSVLHCVAVCCSVLQGKVLTTCLGVSATPTCMLQCVAVCYSVAVRTSVAVRCSVLQCVAVCYRVLTPTPSTAHSPPTATTAEGLANLTDDVALQCVAVRCSVLQCVANYLPLPPRYLHFSLLPPQKDSRT